MTWLRFLLATRAAHAVTLGLWLTLLLAISLLRSLALLPATARRLALVAIASGLSALLALLLPSFGRWLFPVAIGTRLSATLALLLTAFGGWLLAVAIGARLTATLALLLAILLILRRILLVPGLYSSPSGVAYLGGLLLPSLPVAAISFLGVGFLGIVSVVSVVVIQKYVNSGRCCARRNCAISEAMRADDATIDLVNCTTGVCQSRA